jgi:hypothetical protein
MRYEENHSGLTGALEFNADWKDLEERPGAQSPPHRSAVVARHCRHGARITILFAALHESANGP